jgi:hypothetical protein
MTATGIPCIRFAQAWRAASSLISRTLAAIGAARKYRESTCGWVRRQTSPVAHHLLPRPAVGAEREPLDSLGFPRTFQHRREPIG